MWKAEIGERLETEVDQLNQHDRFAVEIIENGLTVEYIRHKILKSSLQV